MSSLYIFVKSLLKLDKQTIRKNALSQRSSLTKVSFWELNEELLNQFILFDWEKVNVVHLFLPISEKKEVDTFEFINFFIYILSYML